MTRLVAGSSRAQLKIQQMAFVLVAFMIFFGLVLVLYVAIKTGSLESSVEDLREQQAQEQVRRLTGSPEFIFSSGSCSSCIDFDKVFALKLLLARNPEYASLWNTRFLQISKVGPSIECTIQNYPDCTTITLVDAEADFSSVDSFIAVCNYDPTIERIRCSLGKALLGVTDT